MKYDQAIHLIANERDALKAVRELAMIGLDAVAASYEPRIVTEFKDQGGALGTVAKTESKALAPRVAREEVTVLDVRNRSEFDAGHLPGALHIPVGYLPARLGEIRATSPSSYSARRVAARPSPLRCCSALASSRSPI